MMRVVMLTTSYPLHCGDVSGVFIQRLASSLSDLAEVSVVVPDSAQLPTSGVSCCRVFRVRYAPRRFQRLCHSSGGIPDALRRRDPALLFLLLLVPALFFRSWRLLRHADVMHGNWSVPAVIGAVAARVAGCAAVATLRGEDVSRARSSRLMRGLLAAALLLNDRVFCVSQAMTSTVREMFPKYAGKVEFIPNGVSSVEHGKQRERRSCLSLVTVGSCIERKRHDLILQAIARPQLRGRTSLIVIGDGPSLSALRALAYQLRIGSFVEFRGKLAPEKTLEVIKEADIFVLASRSEGRPNALMEAMASGLAIVASDIDGVRELLADGRGLTFESGAVDGLERCLLRLHEDQGAVENLGQRARGHIHSLGLTWDKCAQRYFKAYCSIVES